MKRQLKIGDKFVVEVMSLALHDGIVEIEITNILDNTIQINNKQWVKKDFIKEIETINNGYSGYYIIDQIK